MPTAFASRRPKNQGIKIYEASDNLQIAWPGEFRLRFCRARARGADAKDQTGREHDGRLWCPPFLGCGARARLRIETVVTTRDVSKITAAAGKVCAFAYIAQRLSDSK